MISMLLFMVSELVSVLLALFLQVLDSFKKVISAVAAVAIWNISTSREWKDMLATSEIENKSYDYLIIIEMFSLTRSIVGAESIRPPAT